jgi:hypothetical protein
MCGRTCAPPTHSNHPTHKHTIAITTHTHAHSPCPCPCLHRITATCDSSMKKSYLWRMEDSAYPKHVFKINLPYTSANTFEVNTCEGLLPCLPARLHARQGGTAGRDMPATMCWVC